MTDTIVEMSLEQPPQPQIQPQQPLPPYVYLLSSLTSRDTYVGATVNLDRRLRQHNKELSGGAKATHKHQWERVAYVSGFPDWTAALQFEWAWKHVTKSISRKYPPIERRRKALDKLLQQERATTKAIPFVEWATQPTIHWNT